MSLVEQQRRALTDIRQLLAEFVEERIEGREFIPKYRSLFAPFDPPDLTTGDLTKRERRELAVFIRIMGGWFREDDDLIPKRDGWVYGEDTEPFSWIDVDAYRRWIVECLADSDIRLQ